MADGIALRFDNRSYTANEERQLAAVGFHPGSTALLPRPGRRIGGGLEVTVGGTPESAIVQAGGGVLVDTSRGGGYVFVVPSTVTINLSTRPSSGLSRIDNVIVVVKNQDIIVGDAAREIDVQVQTGTAAASPTAPTVPTGALKLAALTVPATGSVTVGAGPGYTTGLGGVLPVASSTERDAIENKYRGLIVYRVDTNVWQGWNGTAWDYLHYGDTGWATISGFASGFSGETGKLPKKRTIRGNEVKIKGRINGTFAANSVVPVLNAGALPSPPEQIERQVTGNSAASTCRAYIGTDGSVTVVTGASAPAYVHIDGLSGYMLD